MLRTARPLQKRLDCVCMLRTRRSALSPSEQMQLAADPDAAYGWGTRHPA